MYVCIHPFIHSVFCLTTGPKPPPKRCLHIVRSRASSFKWEYPLLSWRSSSSFLRLLPRLLVTSISPFIFPSITCFRRQFLRKMWPIQLAFRFLISCRISLCSLTHTWIHNKVRELIAVKVLHSSLLNTTVVAFKVLFLGSYTPMPATSPPFKTILEMFLWNSIN